MKPGSAISILISAFSLIFPVMVAQDTSAVSMELFRKRQGDSLRAAGFLRDAENYSRTGLTDSIIPNVQRSLEISTSSDFPLIEASNYELLGSVYDRLSNWEETLINYLKASSIYKRINLTDKEAAIFRTLGSRYYDLGIYKKSAYYFEQEFNLYPAGNEIFMARASEAAALSYFYIPDDSSAVKWFTTASEYYEKV